MAAADCGFGFGASPSMELPEELVERIAETCVIAGGLKEWCRSWRGTCRRFASREWFEDVVRGGIPLAVVPSERCPTVQLGVSRARPATNDAIQRALSTRRMLSRIAGKSHTDDDEDEDQVLGTGPVVLLTPGVHSENVRMTRTCALLGWGPRGSVVIEGSGWEPALAFAGLGMSERGRGDTMGWSIGDTGEKSFACNVSIKSRNRSNAFAVSVVNGAPKFLKCDLRGGLLVLGWKTSPRLTSCVIADGRGSGVKVTDHGAVALSDCVVERCKLHGLLLERGGRAVLSGACVVRENELEAVLHTPDTEGARLVGERHDLGPPAMVRIATRREKKHDDGDEEGECVSVVVGANVRRLREGTETLEHLHGHAPDYAWLRRGGFEDIDSDEEDDDSDSDFEDEGISVLDLAAPDDERKLDDRFVINQGSFNSRSVAIS